MFDIIGADMPFNMMHANERDPCRKTQCFCKGNTDQQRPHQTRPISHRYRSHIPKFFPGLIKGRLHHLVNFLDMLSRSDLRHHTTINRVQFYLRIYHIGQNFPAVFHYRSRCLITGTFYRQNKYFFFFHLFHHTCTHAAGHMAHFHPVRHMCRTVSQAFFSCLFHRFRFIFGRRPA